MAGHGETRHKATRNSTWAGSRSSSLQRGRRSLDVCLEFSFPEVSVSASRGRAQQLYPVQAPFLASCLSLFCETRYEWSRYLPPLGGRVITKRGGLQVS